MFVEVNLCAIVIEFVAVAIVRIDDLKLASLDPYEYFVVAAAVLSPLQS